MITDKKLGLKVAENPREALIAKTVEDTKTRILELELTLELQKQGLEFLKKLK